MTDKEKLDKLVAEIERKRLLIWPKNDGQMKTVGTPESLEQGWLNALKWMKDIIISMQEESATSVWHDAKDTPVASKTKIVLYTNGKWDMFKAYETKDNYDNYWAGVNQALEEKGVLVRRWAYVVDLLKL